MTKPAAGAAPRLVVDDCTIERGGRVILSAVSFALAPGQAFFVKGANGVGKTTLLRAIAGLLPAARGAIRLDTGALPQSAITYCGHADGVKAAMSVRENVAFWADLYGAPVALIDQAIAAFDLAALEAITAGLLSAGQRRRLGLSRLVVAARPIWLLDEPAASMDAASTARLVGSIENHCAKGGSALIATHDAIAIRDAGTLRVERKAA